MWMPILVLALALGQAGTVGALQAAPDLDRTTIGGGVPPAGATGGPEEVLLEVRLGRWVRWTELAWARDGVPLLPLASFLRRAEVAFEEKDDGEIHGVMHPRGIPFRVTVHGAVRLGARSLELDPSHALVMEGAIHLAAPVLEELLGIRIDTDWSELTVVVRDPEELPVGQRRIREERWRGLRAEAERPPPTRVQVPDGGPVGGFVADWSVASPLDRVVEGSTLGGGVGFRFLGGGLRFTGRSVGPASGGEFRLSGSYEAVRPDGIWLRQVGVGDAFGTGPRPRGQRGVRLTNAPHVRTSGFGVQSLLGRLGPGWEVELRQQGRVLDVSRVDERGAYALDVPVSYGENAVQVVAFGPHGEVLTSEHLLLLSRERLPRGMVEWGVSAGECLDLLCTATGNGDLRVGISSGWTLRAGVDAFARDSLPDVRHAYLGITGMVGSALEVGGEWVDRGWVRGTVTMAPSPHLRVRAAHARFEGELEAPVLFAAGRESTSEADLFLRPRPATEHWVVHGSLVREALGGTRHVRWQVRSTLRTGGFRPEARIRGTGTLGPDGAAIWRVFPGTSVTGMLPVGARLHPWVRGDVEAEGVRGIHQVQVRVGMQAPGRPRVELAGRWHRELGARLALGITAELGALRVLTQAFTSGKDGIQATQVAQGTLRWDGAGRRLVMGPGAGLERGGVSGGVFLDENANGRWDFGEQWLPGVAVTVAGRTVRTDAAGRYRSWDLTPFTSVRVAVEAASLPDPSWVPTDEAVGVLVPPASYQQLDLAVVPSLEIAGRVVLDGWEGQVMSAGGLPLVLEDLGTGAKRDLTTFSDGTFYLMGVVPGEYRLGAAGKTLERLDLDEQRASILLSIRPEDAGSFLPDLLLVLSPRPPDEPLQRPTGG